MVTSHSSRADWLSAPQWGRNLGVSAGRARQLLERYGEKIGAVRLQGPTLQWLVPADAKDPRKPVGWPKGMKRGKKRQLLVRVISRKK